MVEMRCSFCGKWQSEELGFIWGQEKTSVCEHCIALMIPFLVRTPGVDATVPAILFLHAVTQEPRVFAMINVATVLAGMNGEDLETVSLGDFLQRLALALQQELQIVANTYMNSPDEPKSEARAAVVEVLLSLLKLPPILAPI